MFDSKYLILVTDGDDGGGGGAMEVSLFVVVSIPTKA